MGGSYEIDQILVLVGVSPDPESVCTDTSILLFGNVLNAYLNNHTTLYY